MATREIHNSIISSNPFRQMKDFGKRDKKKGAQKAGGTSSGILREIAAQGCSEEGPPSSKPLRDVIAQTIADLEPISSSGVLKLSEITKEDREEHERAKYARIRRQRIDEQARRFRQKMGKRPAASIKELPLRRRPIRRVQRPPRENPFKNGYASIFANMDLQEMAPGPSGT
ncbi:hypothetical protein R3P38DRAFT_2813184 [Favolaschia claudopus]|uniref:Uncharacterized protein n=1 Tax=Favolaschia claudopus TaxID=2862362 RepID=A0AAV9Z6F3_9AGAR